MPESKHDKYMRLYRKNKGDSYEAQEELEREEEEGEGEMDPKTARVGEKIKKAVKNLGKQREAKKLVKGTPIVKGNKIVGKKGGVQNPNIEVQTDSYDPTLDFAERVMESAYDKLTPAQQRDAEHRGKGTRKTVAKVRLRASDEKVAQNVADYRKRFQTKKRKEMDLQKP